MEAESCTKRRCTVDTSQKMFLLAVEEMNFTRAAKRAHVTQQCLSEHIKHLETELGTRLFQRSPRLTLTESGQALQKTLLRISNLEKNLTLKIQEIEKGQIGEIHIGLNATRAQILLPKLLAKFHELYPKVSLTVTLQDTAELVQLMLNQQLDIVLGIDYPPHPLLASIPVGEEVLMLTATNPFLKQHYRGPGPWRDLKPGDCIDLRRFASLPLVGNREKSTVQHLFTSFLHNQGFYPQQIVSISDCEIQFNLCKNGLAAVFSSSFMYQAVQECNRAFPDTPDLIPLRLLHADHKIQTCLFMPKRPFVPLYMQDFLRILSTEIKGYHKEVEAVLGSL